MPSRPLRAHVAPITLLFCVLLTAGVFTLKPGLLMCTAPIPTQIQEKSPASVVPPVLKHVFVGITFKYNRLKLVFLKYVRDHSAWRCMSVSGTMCITMRALQEITASLRLFCASDHRYQRLRHACACLPSVIGACTCLTQAHFARAVT